MDSFFSKFSVFDFFNLLCTGAVTIVSLLFWQIDLFSILDCYIEFDYFNSVLNETVGAIFYFTIFLGVCYIFGSCIQDLSSFIENKILKFEDTAISTFLNDERIIGNRYKQYIYNNLAKKIFTKKQISFSEDGFTREQNKYFYAYCYYFIEIRNQHIKSEKMREIRGISNMLSTCFALIPFVWLLLNMIDKFFVDLIFVNVLNYEMEYFILLCVIFFGLSVVFLFRMKKVTLYRTRMILAVFESSIDKDSNFIIDTPELDNEFDMKALGKK